MNSSILLLVAALFTIVSCVPLSQPESVKEKRALYNVYSSGYHAPSLISSSPAVVAHAPAVVAHAPIVAHAPAVASHSATSYAQFTLGHSAPVYAAAPAYAAAHAPVYAAASAPVYAAHAPVYAAHAPVFSAPAPVYASSPYVIHH